MVFWISLKKKREKILITYYMCENSAAISLKRQVKKLCFKIAKQGSSNLFSCWFAYFLKDSIKNKTQRALNFEAFVFCCVCTF